MMLGSGRLVLALLVIAKQLNRYILSAVTVAKQSPFFLDSFAEGLLGVELSRSPDHR